MTLPLPRLDDRTYTDLVDEARSLIPTYAPNWTDHNASDPGIALLELFAWLAEMLIYRADQIPEPHVVAFLRLLNDPGWTWTVPPGTPADVRAQLLAEQVRATVAQLRRPYRAVTCSDYERLALDTPSAIANVARAHCVPRRHLEASVDDDRPGHLTLLVVPDHPVDGANLAQLHADVTAYLNPRRIVGTQLHVAAPFTAPVHAELFVAARAGVSADDVSADVGAALEGFFDPDTWPFGRSVFVSEVYALLEALPTVDYVPFVRLTSPPSQDAQTEAAEELWHDDGDQIGLALGEFKLPGLLAQPDLYISSAFVGVAAVVKVRADAGAAPADVRRSVKQAVADFFHPRETWPKSVDALKAAIAGAPGVAAVVDEADDPFPVPTTSPDRIDHDPLGHPELRLEAGELFDVTTFVTVV
jgi:hypothetical protein